MGWLEDLGKTTIYNYKESTSGEIVSGTQEELNDFFGCKFECAPGSEVDLGAQKYIYMGFEPNHIGMTTKITFEKNGRVGVRTKFADGKQFVRSMTKEQAMLGKGTKSVLTKGCKDASDKVKDAVVKNRLKNTLNQMRRTK